MIAHTSRLILKPERFDTRRDVALKINPTEQASSDSVAAPSTDTLTQYVTVYTFVVWDHDRRATVIYPRMATRETIAKMRGKVNEDTAWVVEATALDVEGFYCGSSQAQR
jgi:hypothetical protein